MLAPVIKRVTAPIHVRAEEAVRAFDPLASREHYTRYLECLLGFYDAVEPVLAARLGDVVDDVSVRFAKRHAIAADLAWLHVRPTRGPADARLAGSTASALGVAYVLEGKTLGARFLLAEARTSLGLDVDRGATFFGGYGAQTGARWNAYRARLEAWVARHGRRAAILDGARATFASFIACVTSRSSPVSLPLSST